MATQTTSLEAELNALEEKADEYDARTRTEERVKQAKSDLKELNRALRKLQTTLADFEQQAGILTHVFEESLPPGAVSARDEVRSVVSFSQDDIVDIVKDTSQSLSTHTEDIRETREKVEKATRMINDELKIIQKDKLSDAETAENIQRIVGEDRDAMEKISNYKSFLKSILNPSRSVSRLKSQWQGVKKGFENLDTDWEKFQRRHNLSDGTIEDLKELSQNGEAKLDSLNAESVSEMMEVPELRSTIKVSI